MAQQDRTGADGPHLELCAPEERPENRSSGDSVILHFHRVWTADLPGLNAGEERRTWLSADDRMLAEHCLVHPIRGALGHRFPGGIRMLEMPLNSAVDGLLPLYHLRTVFWEKRRSQSYGQVLGRGV